MLVILLEVATTLLFPMATALALLILLPPLIIVSCCSIDTVVNNGLDIIPEVLNVKILRIVSKLCIGIGDTKFDQLMTLFSIDNGFYLGKKQRL